MKLRLKCQTPALLLLGSAFLLLSCSTTPITEPAETSPASHEPEAMIQQSVVPPENKPLSAEELELLLKAEFSIYRRDREQAGRLYKQAAEKTRDLAITRRAYDMAAVLGDTEGALQMAQLWLEIQPGDVPRRAVAQLFARLGETEAAWQIGSGMTDDGLTLRIVAAETVSLGDPNRVLWLEENLASAASAPNISLARVILNEALARTDLATDFAAQAQTGMPADPLAAELYGALLAKQENWLQLEKFLVNWLVGYWKNDNDHLRVVRLISNLPVDRAISALREIIEAQHQTEEIQLLLGLTYVNNNQPEAAEKVFTSLARHQAYADISYFQLAELEELRGDLAAAIAYFATVEPGNLFEQANRRAGDILVSSGNSPNSISEYFDRQRNSHPQVSEGLYSLEAEFLNQRRLGQELYETTTRGLSIAPTNLDLLYLRSLASERLDQLSAVESDLRRILELDPDNVSALNALGYFLTDRTNRHQEAFELISRALQLDPESPAIIDSMGWVLYHLKRYDEALIYLMQAHARFYDEEIILHLAETLIKLDRGQEARALLEEARINLPQSSLLREAQQRLFPQSGQS